MQKGVTVILTDNNRVDLLRKTLVSFFEMNTYPINEFHIHNDGRDTLFKKLMADFPNINWYFSNKIIGYAASLDFLLEKVKTEYVFTSESDWLYYKNPGFIERSLKILQENKDIHQCWIRDESDHNHPLYSEIEVSGIKVRPVTHGYRKFWNGWSLNPGLRRMSDLKRFFPNGLIEHRDEIDQAKHVQQFNYRAVSLVESTIKHIGWGRRSINFKP
jgi:hypothetical protein